MTVYIIVERGADGSRVLYWYHRQFIEAARVRYCSQAERNRQIHIALADFFAGTWSKGRIIVDKNWLAEANL